MQAVDKRYPNRLETIVIEEALKRFRVHYLAQEAMATAERELQVIKMAIKGDEFLEAEFERRSQDWKRWEDQGITLT